MKAFKFRCLLCQEDLRKRPIKDKEDTYFCCNECFQQAVDVLKFQNTNFPESFEQRLKDLGTDEP